jgi:hypothetical protein
MNANRSLLLALGLTVLFHGSADACAVCAGGDNATLIEASNSVLWVLLALVGFIFVATAGTAYFLWRKAHTPVPPHIEFIENLSSSDDED